MKKDLAHFLETVDSKKMVRALSWVVASAAAFMGATYFAYFQEFHGDFSAKQEVWGQFGDFIGGTVNPLLSFLSLLALVFTVVLQTRQLEHSREELANSKLELDATREELKRSAELQAEMASAAHAQAKYANVSARLSALQAALSIASESLAQAQKTGAAEYYVELLKRKERLAGEIIEITDELLSGEDKKEG